MTADDVAFTYNYVVKNEMLNMAITTVGIGRRWSPPTSCRSPATGPRPTWSTSSCRSCPSMSGRTSIPRRADAATRTSRPSSARARSDDRVQEGRLREDGAQPLLLGHDAGARRAPLPQLHERRHHDRRPQVGEHRRRLGHTRGAVRSLASVGFEPVAYNFFNWDYLNLNCYEGKSLGNPVLKDWRFRNALNYAVDRQARATSPTSARRRRARRSCRRVVEGPRLPLGAGRGQLYTFDLAKAGALLDAAGFRRGQDGIRQYRGKPIELRLWTTTESASAADRPMLIAGWFKKLGLKVDLSVHDGPPGPRLELRGQRVLPDFDMYIWDWAGYGDPGRRSRPRPRRRSATPTNRAGRTPSTTSLSTSDTAMDPPRARTSSGGCSRSCTSRRRWSSPTRSTWRPTAPPSGRAGRA